ncbi:MAG TPA: permease prefix domain 1-containing protein [Mycobacteriales bacterium]|nr:permease prefix domain 1-containing protein [Mycobacteriales bacterium]
MTEPDDGPVEAYLDRMFDLLAGSGGTGRRALAEVEAHLSEAVGEAQAGGASRIEAERLAVRRFGPVQTVAAGLLAARRGGFGALLRRVFATAWLVGGAGMVVIGLSAAPVWAVGRFLGRDLVAPDPPEAHYTAARCAELFEYFPHAGSCRAASISHHFDEQVRNRVAAGVLGLLVLAAFWLIRRSNRRWLARFRGLIEVPPTPVVVAVAATAFGVVAMLLTGQGLDAVMIGQRAGTGAVLASGLVSALAFAAVLPALVRDLRMRPD